MTLINRAIAINDHSQFFQFIKVYWTQFVKLNKLRLLRTHIPHFKK